MKRLLLAGLLVCVAAPAFAAGGTANSPFYVREQQGLTRTFKEVSCASAGDTALVTATEAQNARSILFQNPSTTSTDIVTLCPVAAAATVCDNAAEGLSLFASGSLPIDRAIRDGAWSCKSNTAGALTVEVLIEK